jgi:hypothetical protein
VLKKPSRNSDADEVPDVRADEPERAMDHFTAGLKRVLSARKVSVMGGRTFDRPAAKCDTDAALPQRTESDAQYEGVQKCDSGARPLVGSS